MRVSLFCILLIVYLEFFIATTVPDALHDALSAASPGDIVDLSSLKIDQSKDIINNGSANNSLLEYGDALLYSDDPETVYDYGILYQDSLEQGCNRIYVYHLSGISLSSKVTVVVSNNEQQHVDAYFIRKSLPEPSSSFIDVGRAGVQLFYQNLSAMPNPISLNYGDVALLDDELDQCKLQNGQLLAAIYDICSSASLTFTALMLPFQESTLNTFQTYSFVAKDGHNRLGTFAMNGKTTWASVDYATTDDVKYFEIASNVKYTQNDPPLEGIIPQTNESVSLAGNYGVGYEVKLAVHNTESKSVRLCVVLNPRGGSYGGFIQFIDNEHAIIDQLIDTVSSPSEGVVLGYFDIPVTSSPISLTMNFMPAGSTSLPVWLILIPVR
jgi:hypothetical protein